MILKNNVDTKAFMYGRVVNKKARYNLCFADESQEPDYEAGKGRVVHFRDVPHINKLRAFLGELIGDKAKHLLAELNYYYDTRQCGIGFHGDSERKRVVGCRFGASMDLVYQWYYKGERIGNKILVPLKEGDIYIMSEKAVGFDWKKKNTPTLRHATGCSKFTE
jgi:hypothetical protein